MPSGAVSRRPAGIGLTGRRPGRDGRVPCSARTCGGMIWLGRGGPGMSDLVVITFPNETDGPAALQAMREAQRNAGLALKDVAAVTKDADGKVHTHNETDSTTLTGI